MKINNCHTWYHTCPYVEFLFSHCVFEDKPLPFELVTIHVLVKKSPHQLLHCGSDHQPQLLKLVLCNHILPLYWSNGQYYWSLYTCINDSVIVLEGDSSLKIWQQKPARNIFCFGKRLFTLCIIELETLKVKTEFATFREINLSPAIVSSYTVFILSSECQYTL